MHRTEAQKLHCLSSARLRERHLVVAVVELHVTLDAIETSSLSAERLAIV